MTVHEFARSVSRRSFLGQSAYGLGSLALAHLLGGDSAAAESADTSSGAWHGVINKSHRPVKARRVIHLCMAGGPSQFETLDWKPALKKLDGQPFPASLTSGQQLAQLQN